MLRVLGCLPRHGARRILNRRVSEKEENRAQKWE
jgi:hypothetical protein